MGLNEVPTLPCQRSGFPLSPQRLLGSPGYLHSPEMGSSSSVSSWAVGVPSVPAAAPAWPLVALDAFPPVADHTPPVLDNTLPLLDHTLCLAAGVLPGVTSVLDDHLSGVEPSVP